ncbi:MAG TPA: hypothetical protein VFW55_07880 [Propionicimonas sp.]|nr:hypothetical protein [Propionicimonas sp.]
MPFPAGLPASVVQAEPGLSGYLALRVDRRTVRRFPGITSGDVFSGTRLVASTRQKRRSCGRAMARPQLFTSAAIW